MKFVMNLKLLNSPKAGSAKGFAEILCSLLSLFKYFIQLSMFMCRVNCHLYFSPLENGS